MRTERVELVEKKIITYSCDLCEYVTENNRGCCGTAPVMTCHFCRKDVCRNCRIFYTEEEWVDYPHGAYACVSCQPRAEMAWYLAKMTAGRYDNIVEVMDNWFAAEDLEEVYNVHE